VQAVVPGSPATSPVDLVGNQVLVPGDVILAVGDVDVASLGDLVAAIRRLRPQNPVVLTIIRGDKVRQEVQVPALGASQALGADLAIVA
jgi:S1-C subfamily serine protease